MKKNFLSISIPKLPFYTTEEAIKEIKKNMKYLNDWTEITDIIPQKFKKTLRLKRSGLTGVFAASLELTREGLIRIMQKKNFDRVLIKEKR